MRFVPGRFPETADMVSLQRRFFRLRFPGLGLGAMLLLGAVGPGGCGSAPGPPTDIALAWELTPSPPQTGPAVLTFTLTDSTGGPVTGAEVELEANMAHPGMRPLFATATETAPGRYAARMSFSMAGDWVVLVTFALPDGRMLIRQIDIPGVAVP